MRFRTTRAIFLTLLLICAIGQYVMAQGIPWHPIPNGQFALFDRTLNQTRDTYIALKVDSLRLEGTDTAYYFFRSFKSLLPFDTVYDCQGMPLNQPLVSAIFIDEDHHLGQKLLWRPDSSCAFVFSSGDTFLLRSQAGLGESWPWGNSDTATVDTIVEQMILGQLDSVKAISLTSGGKILLSKRHGLVQFRWFREELNYSGLPDTTSWHLWGIPSLALGGHFPTFEDRYFHQIGDRWTYTFTEGNLAEQAYNQGYYEEFKIVGLLPGNPYRYQVQYQKLPYYPFGQYGAMIGPNIYTLNYDSSGFDPYEQIPELWTANSNLFGGWGWGQSSFNGRLLTSDVTGSYIDTRSNTLIGLTYYLNVMGTTGSAYSHYWDGGDFDRKELTCFERGTDIWGTCPDLHAMSVVAKQEARLTVFPVPAREILQVSLSENAAIQELVLMDLNGRVVANGVADRYEGLIDVSKLVAGSYLLQVLDLDGGISHRHVVVDH